MPKRSTMTQGGGPLDQSAIAEVLSSFEGTQIDDIPFGPNLVGGIMSDAALIIRALADKAGVEVQ